MNTKMFAISALCATVAITASAAEIVSSDVVGYQQKDMTPVSGTVGSSYYLITPTFKDIGVDGVNIKNIVPVSSTTIASGDISFQVLNTSRGAAKTYNWEPVAYKKDGVTIKVYQGWYDGTTGDLDETYVVKPGDALMISAPYAFQITFNGAVKDSATVFEATAAGYYTVGNPTPVPVKIKDIIPVATTEGDSIASGDISFQVLNTSRGAAKTYNWEPVAYKKDGVTIKVYQGWYDGTTGNLDESYEIAAGDAVLLYTPKAIKITFPSPL